MLKLHCYSPPGCTKTFHTVVSILILSSGILILLISVLVTSIGHFCSVVCLLLGNCQLRILAKVSCTKNIIYVFKTIFHQDLHLFIYLFPDHFAAIAFRLQCKTSLHLKRETALSTTFCPFYRSAHCIVEKICTEMCVWPLFYCEQLMGAHYS